MAECSIHPGNLLPGCRPCRDGPKNSEPLASMTDDVSGISLSLHRGGRHYLITTADGRSLDLNVTEWLGLVDLAGKWLENS